MAKVAILGLGAMGSRMAQSLLRADHNVTVWNRSSEKATPLTNSGARFASTPRLAAQDAEFVISMVRDDEASKAVWLDPESGALTGLKPDSVAIESSTVSATWATELAMHCQNHNIQFLDAPVAGSRPQAEAARLIYFVGGEASIVAKTEGILRSMGGAVHHVGPAGHGATLKLIVNVLFGTQLALMGELIAIMQHAGLDVRAAIEIISATPVCSPAVKFAASAMLAGDFLPQFPIELVEKDFRYARETATALAVTAPITTIVGDIFSEMIRRGYGTENITAVLKHFIGKQG